jgi:hypothetical protein
LESCKLRESAIMQVRTLGLCRAINERERFRYDRVSNEHPFDNIFIARNEVIRSRSDKVF